MAKRKLENGLRNLNRALCPSLKQSCSSRKDHMELRRTSACSFPSLSSTLVVITGCTVFIVAVVRVVVVAAVVAAAEVTHIHR